MTNAMMNQDKPPTCEPEINVGIYGCTKAGKTRFLFQLLDGWKRQDRLLPQSDQALSFLAQVRAEIEKHGESMPTAATTEGISVRIRPEHAEPARQFVFRDLRGELLTDEIPPAGEIARHGVVARQVAECDAFLFLFDPGSSDNPAQIDRRHERELKRAKMFIEYVLARRENRYLPIVFLLTHHDLWKNDEQVAAKAERWRDEVNRELRDQYRATLKEHFPPELVDVNRTSLCLSSVREADVSTAVERLVELVSEVKQFCRKDTDGMRLFLIRSTLALAAIVLLVCGLFLIPRQSPISEINPPPVGEMSEKEILRKLDDLERAIEAHPQGGQPPAIAEAPDINHPLRWLTRRMRPDSGATTELSEETRQRGRSAMNSVGTLSCEVAENDAIPISDRSALLAAYLEDLPDCTGLSDDLAAAQTRYWRLLRSQIVAQVAVILQRRDSVASPPLGTLAEVLNKLRGVASEVTRSKVFGPVARQALVEEIQTGATFCEDRKKSRSYTTVLRVVSAADSSEKQADLALRNLRILSPNRKDELSKDGIALIPNNDSIPIDVEAVVHWGAECWDGYDNSVKLSMNGVTHWELNAKSQPNTASSLGARRLKCKRSDTITFAVQLQVTDGTFVVSKREHGKGGLSAKVGDLLDGKQTIVLDRFENRMVVTATRADGGQPNRFHTKEQKYQLEIGLGAPVICVLSLHNRLENKWHKLQEFDLTTKPGPLAPLGLPLLWPGKAEVSKHLTVKQMELDVKFSNFSPVPALILEAAKCAQDKKP